MILCDTGPLVAAFNEADRDHSRCVRFLQENWSRLVVPSLAVTEVCHLLGDTHWQGHRAMRISVSGWNTTEDDIDHSLAAVRARARS